MNIKKSNTKHGFILGWMVLLIAIVPPVIALAAILIIKPLMTDHPGWDVVGDEEGLERWWEQSPPPPAQSTPVPVGWMPTGPRWSE